MAEYKTLPPKAPTAKLDYVFDWAPAENNTGLSNWLAEGETISSYTLTISDGIDKVSDALIKNSTAILVWLDNGTVGEDYLIVCSVVTNQGREDTRTFILPVRLR